MDLTDVMDWDGRLALGDVVEVRWTNSGRHYAGQGTVEKLNDGSVKVKLTRDVGIHADRHNPAAKPVYPVGFVVTVPRCTFRSVKRWTWNNGVFPPPRCPGCGVMYVGFDVEHLDNCLYQGSKALPLPA